MSIILEGCDGSGKTTLAQLLQKLNPDIQYYSSGGPPKNVDEMIHFCADQRLLVQYENQILDRVTPISHPIYHPGLSTWQSNYLSHMADVLLKTPNTVLVYCRPSTEHLLNPKIHNWKDYDTPEHIEFILNQQHNIIQRYDHFMTHHAHVIYNFEDEDLAPELAGFLAAADSTLEILTKLKKTMQVETSTKF